jgi:hypothetical protein
MSIVRQQLAYNLNLIIFNYTQNNNINKFYKKLNKLSTCIFKNNSNTLYYYYINDINIINTNIINKKIDITFINDFIYLLKKIILELLYFE